MRLIAEVWRYINIIRYSFILCHDDVIKWKHFPRNWPFVRKIHRSPVNFPHKGQWRGALMFSLIYVWINDWANNREAGDLRRQHGHYDVIVMSLFFRSSTKSRNSVSSIIVLGADPIVDTYHKPPDWYKKCLDCLFVIGDVEGCNSEDIPPTRRPPFWFIYSYKIASKLGVGWLQIVCCGTSPSGSFRLLGRYTTTIHYNIATWVGYASNCINQNTM